nr:MAG TPA: hypothetical protein [Caudoviricetes sp.]
MAITMRHGPYNKFDPQKLRTAEIAVVTEGDPHASDGKAIYQCFSPGDVKRMATYEDMLDQIDEAGGDAIDNHIEQKVGTALKACEDATKAAQDAKTNADKAVSSANTAASSASTAANTANKAAEAASKAAEDCKNLIDEKHVAEIEKAVQQSLMVDAVDGTVTGKTVTDLPENTTPADTDYFLNATGNAMKKTKVSQLITWLKEKLGINALNTKMNDYVTIKNFAQKITLKSGIATVNINAALDGYILLGIVRCSFASSYLTTTGYTLSGNNLSLNVRDVSAPTTSSASANCYVTALYVKN